MAQRIRPHSLDELLDNSSVAVDSRLVDRLRAGGIGGADVGLPLDQLDHNVEHPSDGWKSPHNMI